MQKAGFQPTRRDRWILWKGDEGEAVEMVQNRLSEIGYATGHVDGIYGPRTHMAVVRFQSVHNLKLSGSICPETWVELFKRKETT